MGAYTIEQFSESIDTTRYVQLFHNVFLFFVGSAMLAISLWLRFDSGLSEWIEWLECEEFYIGVYILLFAALLTMLTTFAGCAYPLMENTIIGWGFMISQAVCFIIGSVGSAVLLNFSTMHSSIQPLIRESLRKMIINAHHEESRQILAAIQEGVGCCGADGAVDYTSLRQPVPEQCRDTITGNPYYYGCVEELTSFFVGKTEWLAGITMCAALMQVINIVYTIILMQAVKKEDEIKNNHQAAKR